MPLRREVRDRRAQDRKARFVEQASDGAGDAPPLRELAPQVVVEQLDATASEPLGAIRRDVGVRQDLVRRQRVVTASRRNADARADQHFVTVNVVRLAHRGKKAVGEHRRLRDRAHVGAADDELVATESHARVSVAHMLRSRCATCTSSSSPAACPSMSFTRLKPSRSMNNSATSPPPRRVRASAAFSSSTSSARLPRPRQPIVSGVVFESFFETVTLGHILERPQEAGERAVRPPQRNPARAHPSQRARRRREPHLARTGLRTISGEPFLHAQRLDVLGMDRAAPPAAECLVRRTPG